MKLRIATIFIVIAITTVLCIFCLKEDTGCPAIITPTPIHTPVPTATIEPFEPIVIEFAVVDIYCHKTIAKNAMGETIILCENRLATKPTKAKLESFLNNDLTDEMPYAAPEWTCADYVREVHNNAELAGIRAYMVGVMPKGTEHKPHALLGVDTTDAGTLYIDCMYDAWVIARAGSVMVYTNLRPTVYFGEIDVFEVKSILEVSR